MLARFVLPVQHNIRDLRIDNLSGLEEVDRFLLDMVFAQLKSNFQRNILRQKSNNLLGLLRVDMSPFHMIFG